jgi:hypothetical protein
MSIRPRLLCPRAKVHGRCVLLDDGFLGRCVLLDDGSLGRCVLLDDGSLGRCVLLDDASFGRYTRPFHDALTVIYLFLQGGHKASGVTQDYASSRGGDYLPVCGPGSGHFGHGCMIQGTCPQRDVSSTGCIIQGTHRPRHSSYKDYRTGTNRSGTHRHSIVDAVDYL